MKGIYLQILCVWMSSIRKDSKGYLLLFVHPGHNSRWSIMTEAVSHLCPIAFGIESITSFIFIRQALDFCGKQIHHALGNNSGLFFWKFAFVEQNPHESYDVVCGWENPWMTCNSSKEVGQSFMSFSSYYPFSHLWNKIFFTCIVLSGCYFISLWNRRIEAGIQ